MDPHRILGVGLGASDDEIKAAFRKAAMRWHPDRNSGSGPEAAARAADEFKKASDAYEYLTGKHGTGVGSRQGNSAGSGARRPWSSSAGSHPGWGGAGGAHYSGDDPFGFRHAQATTHARRIQRNIRVAYATLACIGAFVYLAPEPPSPAEAARARKRQGNRGKQGLTFSEQAVPQLAPGSPLYAKQPEDDGVADIEQAGKYGGYGHVYAYDDAGEATRGEAYGLTHRAARSSPPRGAATLGETEQRAALQAEWSRARFGAKVIAEGGGERCRAAAAAVETAADAPEWANGGYAGRGISRRVLPYNKGRGRGGRAELACARCGFQLSPVARFCSICGLRTTSPGSVVRRPIADPQDTGLSTGRGRERAKAAAAAASAAAAAAAVAEEEEEGEGTAVPATELAADRSNSAGAPSPPVDRATEVT